MRDCDQHWTTAQPPPSFPDVRRTHFVEPQLLVPTRMQFSTARRRGGRTGSGTSSTTHIQRTSGRATQSSRTFHGGDRVLFLRQFKMTDTASGLHVESSRDIRGGLQIKVGGLDNVNFFDDSKQVGVEYLPVLP